MRSQHLRSCHALRTSTIVAITRSVTAGTSGVHPRPAEHLAYRIARVAPHRWGPDVVSSGQGLLGWREARLRTSIAVDVITTVVATLALAIAAARPHD
jgi:hypothetical protein